MAKNSKAKQAKTKAVRDPKKTGETTGKRVAEELTPAWLVPTALTLLIGGILYLVIYYITTAQYPLPIGDWNMLVAFVLIIFGGILFTRWK